MKTKPGTMNYDRGTRTTEAIETKTTGQYRLAVVKRTFEDGRETFGVATSRRGGKWSIGWGYNEKQARRIVKKHHTMPHNPSVLICD